MVFVPFVAPPNDQIGGSVSNEMKGTKISV